MSGDLLPNVFSGFNSSVKYDLLREVCSKSFYRFVQEFWHVVVPQKPVWNWHIEYICQKLQGMFENVMDGKPKDHDIILNLPPSSSKCCHVSTMVLCENGYIRAGDISVGEMVYSVDYETNAMFSQPIVEKTSFDTECLEVCTEFGQSLICSLNHPFMTQRGWVNAEDITTKDFVQEIFEDSLHSTPGPNQFSQSYYPYEVVLPKIVNGTVVIENGDVIYIPGNGHALSRGRKSLRLCRKSVGIVPLSVLDTLFSFEPELCTLCHAPYRWSRIKSVDHVGKKTVVGIELESEEYDKKNFITNNIITHNSTLASILFPAYAWTKFPEARLITASFSLDLSMDFARKSKMVMQSDLYERCFGKFRFYPDRADHYANQFGGSRHAFSTQISPTGRHAHMIIIDDPIDPNDLDRQNSLYAVNHWISRVVRTRTVDARVTPLFLVMQRLSLDDPTGDWLAKSAHNPEYAKIFHIKLPASIEKEQEVKPPGLKRYYTEGLFDPVRLSYDVLANKKAWMSVADYSAQYDQNPLPQEGLMFKVQNLVPRKIDELDPIIQKVRYWDKAGTTSKDACFTVGALMGRTARGRFYILDIIRGQWGPAEREDIIAHTAAVDGPKVLIGIEQEPGSAGIDSINLTTANLAGYNVVADKAAVNKIHRAEALAIQVEHENVFLQEGGKWIPTFLTEIRDFPIAPIKDQVDAVSGAFRLLTGVYGYRIAGAL